MTLHNKPICDNIGVMSKIYRKGLDRFWHHIERGSPQDCWLWRGPVNNGKYGVFTINKPYRTSMTAHRQAFILAGGEIPKGQIVRHKCDTPLCCNPAHLESGTHKQNHDDMVARGRGDWQRGHKRAFSGRVKKLTDDDVRGIRTAFKEGHPRNWIANAFGCSEAHVNAILLGKRKAHVV